MITKLRVEGMSCGHCMSRVEKALQAVEGVESAEVNLGSGTATVEHSPDVSVEILAEAVENAGYRVVSKA